MLIAIAIIVCGAYLTLCAATAVECKYCYKRDPAIAYWGFALVLVGCLLACLKFGGVL